MGDLPPLKVVAGIIWSQNRFLAALRPPGKPMAGFWELPGGKIEPGESPRMALDRELREELGIGVTEAAFYKSDIFEYPANGLAVRLYFLEVHAFTGEPQSLEGQRLAWIHPVQWREYNFLAADQPVLLELAARSKDC